MDGRPSVAFRKLSEPDTANGSAAPALAWSALRKRFVVAWSFNDGEYFAHCTDPDLVATTFLRRDGSRTGAPRDAQVDTPLPTLATDDDGAPCRLIDVYGLSLLGGDAAPLLGWAGTIYPIPPQAWIRPLG